MELLEWGAVADPGRVTDAPAPLFPRVESEASEPVEA